MASDVSWLHCFDFGLSDLTLLTSQPSFTLRITTGAESIARHVGTLHAGMLCSLFSVCSTDSTEDAEAAANRRDSTLYNPDASISDIVGTLDGALALDAILRSYSVAAPPPASCDTSSLPYKAGSLTRAFSLCHLISSHVLARKST